MGLAAFAGTRSPLHLHCPFLPPLASKPVGSKTVPGHPPLLQWSAAGVAPTCPRGHLWLLQPEKCHWCLAGGGGQGCHSAPAVYDLVWRGPVLPPSQELAASLTRTDSKAWSPHIPTRLATSWVSRGPSPAAASDPAPHSPGWLIPWLPGPKHSTCHPSTALMPTLTPPARERSRPWSPTCPGLPAHFSKPHRLPCCSRPGPRVQSH